MLNASEHGLAILAGSHAALATLPLDHPITLAIFLDGLGTLENVGRLRHREGKVLGLALDSPLEAEFLAALGGICENR